MRLRMAIAALFLGGLLTLGCSKAVPSKYNYQGMAASLASVPRLRQYRTQRFVAVQHTLEIQTTEAELQKDWEATIAFCATIRCEVTGSNLSSGAAPSASVSLRVAPEDLPRLFGHLGTGRIVRHATVTEDKTDDVIDADAKIKNLTSYRDSLRELLKKSSASLKDLVEIQGELSKVQSELDSEMMKREVLATQTEKVAVEIQFATEASVARQGFFDRIVAAWREAGYTFGESVGNLILVVVAVLPWLVVLAPAGWGTWKLVRRLRRKRAARVPPTLTGQA
jgi:hypothetical protein